MEKIATELEQAPMTESITIEIVKTEVKVEKLTFEVGKETTVEVEDIEVIPVEADIILRKIKV